MDLNTEHSRPVQASAGPMSKRQVTIYPITGHRSSSRCRNPGARNATSPSAASGAWREIGEVGVRVKPWFDHLSDALLRGGWHAPVVTIDGQVFSRGVVAKAQFREALLTGTDS